MYDDNILFRAGLEAEEAQKSPDPLYVVYTCEESLLVPLSGSIRGIVVSQLTFRGVRTPYLRVTYQPGPLRTLQLFGSGVCRIDIPDRIIRVFQVS